MYVGRPTAYIVTCSSTCKAHLITTPLSKYLWESHFYKSLSFNIFIFLFSIVPFFMEEQQYCNNHISQETAARNLLSKYIYNGRHKNDKIKKELVKTKPVFFLFRNKIIMLCFQWRWLGKYITVMWQNKKPARSSQVISRSRFQMIMKFR